MSGIAIFISTSFGESWAAALRYRIGSPHAFDHLDAQQVCAKFLAIGGDTAQLVVNPLALARVLLLDIALVFDGLTLKILLRDSSPLAVVKIEQGLACAIADDGGELVGEVEGVVETEVHAHPAQRIVDVGGVARNEQPPVTIA